MFETENNTTATPTENAAGTTSAATEITEQQIPYSRFKEVNAAKTAAERRIAEFEAAEAERKQKESLANGKFQEVIDDLKPKAERATALEATLQKYLDAEIAEIPEDKRAHVPKGDVTATLEWIKAAKTAGLFGTPKAPNMDAGATGDRTNKAVALTPAELQMAKNMRMTPEAYAKHKTTGKAS